MYTQVTSTFQAEPNIISLTVYLPYLETTPPLLVKISTTQIRPNDVENHFQSE